MRPHVEVMFETLPYVRGHLTGGHLQQSSGLPALKYPGNPVSHAECFVMLTWPVPGWQAPGLHCMKSTKSWKMFLQAWDLEFS